jgi:hypothetical protein
MAVSIEGLAHLGVDIGRLTAARYQPLVVVVPDGNGTSAFTTSR